MRHAITLITESQQRVIVCTCKDNLKPDSNSEARRQLAAHVVKHQRQNEKTVTCTINIEKHGHKRALTVRHASGRLLCQQVVAPQDVTTTCAALVRGLNDYADGAS